MRSGTFIRRGLSHFRSSYVGVVLGASLGATVLLGALFAGDSVKGTLRGVTEARLGRVDLLVAGGDRFFRSALADDLERSGVGAAPVLFLEGSVSAQRGGRSTGRVQLLGVDERFWSFGPDGKGEEGAAPSGREVFINTHLARSVGAGEGDAVVLRFVKPGFISRDAPMSGSAEGVITIRGTVKEVLDDDRFGRFSLDASQLPRASVFLPIGRLQEVIELEGRANMLLLRDDKAAGPGAMGARIGKHFTLEDYGLSLEDVPLAEATGIRTRRVFFDRRMQDGVKDVFPEARPVITYLANTIAANGRETPYSMVTATEADSAPFLPEQGVALNAWTAEDLGAEVGDTVTIEYYGVSGGSTLEERSASLVVGAVVPMEGLAADPQWMPDFPGVSDAESTGDWSPGLPLDLERMRDKDDAYWERYRGAPKVILPLGEGRALFANRWGEFTSLRVPWSTASAGEIEARLLEKLEPMTAGLVVRDFRGEGMRAAQSPVDIGQLFLSMSFFLIIAAVALTAMLFRFNIEQRNRESGLLAAVGVPARNVLRWRLLEGFWVVFLGGVSGLVVAAAYTWGILRFLETIWSEGESARLFVFEVNPATAAGGLAGFLVLMMAVIWMTVRKQVRRSASMRLEAGTEEVRNGRGNLALIMAVVLCAGGLGAMGLGGVMGPQGAFFLAGFALLAGGLSFYRWRLGGQAGGGVVSVGALAAANSGRRPLRSLVVVGALASGVFLVVAVAAFRKHTGDEWQERASGAGGFAFWIETTAALTRAEDGSEDYFELGEKRGEAGVLVPFRLGQGDDANCFNLNAVSRPRLLATDTAKLAELGAFEIKDAVEGAARNWEALRGGETMRGFIDETTLMWVLKMKVGDRLTYEDEWGEPFEIEIAGTIADSVFQGNLVVDEGRFLKRFPGAEGYRVFLAEAVSGIPEVKAMLQGALADRGAEVVTTKERLAAFHGVENTYIAIFHVLGGLGVVLGAAGLGLVTARNLAERRYEFAVLHTIGVPREVSRRLVFREVASFIAWGLGIGTAAALVSIIPNLGGVDPAGAAGWVVLLVAGIALNAWFWAWLGYRKSIEGVLQARVTG
jgi:ABC-type lipoprotein release transport system permease subunit